MRAVDGRDIELFAGAGGFSEGAAMLGLRPLGVEWDDAACATRRARGHETLQADVSALDPREFAPVRLMIASPPCQAFSMAGSGEGRKAMDAYLEAIARWVEGKPPSREELDAACDDERAHLVLEVLRWAIDARPQFIACEQVKEVLPLWEAIATALRKLGYGTWCGVLSTECYGVPQTRKRAILMAVLDGQPVAPARTHQRYIAPRKREEATESLFDAPEPERIVAPEDRELLPWISMAEALGWGRQDQVGFPRLADTPSNRTSGRVEIDGEEYRERDLREASEPALTEKARSWQRWHYRNGNQDNAAVRAADEPALTVHFGHALNSGIEWTTTPDEPWEAGPPTHMNTGRDWKPGGSREDAQSIPVSEPSPALDTQGGKLHWVQERPATTRQGDPRIFPPGHFHRNDDGGAEAAGPNGAAVRVSIEEAAVLQGFPMDGYFDLEAEAMTRDELAAVLLAAGHIECDPESGRIWRWRGPGGVRRAERVEIRGTELKGYLVGTFKLKDVRKQIRLHRLVWIAAHGVPAPGVDIDHKNGDKKDNRLDNLQPLTPSKHSQIGHERGQMNYKRKLTDEDCDLIVEAVVVDRETHRAVAERFGVSRGRVTQLMQARGYPWQGTRTAQYRQVGDAVPPPFARAILESLLS